MELPSPVQKGLLSSVHEVLHQVDNSTLVPDNCFEIESEVMDIAHRWQQFGRALHIRQEKLDEIKAEVGSVPRECLTKTIQEFLKKNYDWKEHGEPSWRLVVIAVGHKVGGANTELALQIAKDHPTKSPPKKRSGSTSVHDFSVLMEVSRTGDVETAKNLLDRGANPNLANRVRREGWTALMAAANNGQYGTVDILLNRGANPDMQDNSGWSALMAAVYKRHDEVALRIIKAGATPHLQDKNKTNALLLAIGRSNEEKVVNSLLDCKPSLDLQDSYGETALIYACKMRNLHLVKRLLAMGADPNICNNVGESPALIAGAKREMEILELLLSNGADPDTGVAPLLVVASQMGDDKMVDIIVSHTADPKQENKIGITAAQVAEKCNHTQIAKKLNPEKTSSTAEETSIFTDVVAALVSLREHLDIGPLYMNREAAGETKDSSYRFGFLGKVLKSIIQ